MKSTTSPSKSSDPIPFTRTQSNNTADVRLHQDSTSLPSTPSPSQAGSPGTLQLDGMIDRGAKQGMVYLYSAQRVQIIDPGGKSIEIRSEPTAPTTIAMSDNFPPAPPNGLVSVPGTATTQFGPIGTVDLAWRPNIETDLAGYFVYRTDLAETTSPAAKPVRLNASPSPASTYRDESALPGHRYAYRVAAVDRNGNVSAFSLPVEDAPEVR